MNRLLAFFPLVFVPSLLGCAQNGVTTKCEQQSVESVAMDSTRVFTFVEQMPALPSGGGIAEILSVITKSIKVPAIEKQLPWQLVTVYFIVGPSGVIYGERISHSSGVLLYDEAVLKSVRALPRLKPGYSAGSPGAVGFDLPIRIHWQ